MLSHIADKSQIRPIQKFVISLSVLATERPNSLAAYQSSSAHYYSKVSKVNRDKHGLGHSSDRHQIILHHLKTTATQ